MPINADVPRSPGWWLKRLLEKLQKNQSRYDELDRYYRNENVIPVHASRKVAEAYRRLMRISRTNFAELIVEATRERVNLLGFRTAAGGDENGDAEARRIANANSFPILSIDTHRMLFSLADAYVVVGPTDPRIGAPLVSVEDPRQCVAEFDPVLRNRALAAVKVWHDDVEKADRAVLFLPGWALPASKPSVGETLDLSWGAWEPDGDPIRLLDGEIPVVRFANRPDSFGNGVAEFEPHIPLLDRINYTVLSRVETATLQAFRQRAVKGLPLRDSQGNEIDYSDIFAMEPGALWQLPPAAEMWESGQVDLGPIRQAVRDDIQDLAAVTRVPLFYLTPDAANGSAEGASLAREGLVFKVQDRIAYIAESWKHVMRYAFLFAGDEQRAQLAELEPIFASPDRVSMAERYDAAAKAAAAGVPWRTRMSDVLQFTPDAIARMEVERAEDAFAAVALAPTAASASSSSVDEPQPVPDEVV